MKKIGLVLGGGGARGAYQVGVLKALEEIKLLKRVKVISGTSIGAINGFMLLNGLNVERLKTMWYDFQSADIYSVNPLGVAFHSNALFNFDKLLEKIRPFLNPKAFRKGKKQGYVTLARAPGSNVLARLQLLNYEKEVVHLNKADDPVLATVASASIPFVFSNREIDGHLYVDGGLVDNFPYEPLYNEGCDIIISIALQASEGKISAPLSKMWIDFTPSEDLGGLVRSALDFSEDKLSSYYELGYKNGIELLKHLKKEKVFGFFGNVRFKRGVFYNLHSVPLPK